MAELKRTKIADLVCDECGGYADVVIEEQSTIANLPIKIHRFLCFECEEKEK